MILLYAAFLTGLHSITVIDARTMYAVYARLQSLRITEFRVSIGKDVLKQRIELKSSKTFFHAVKDEARGTLEAAIHEEGKKELFLCKKAAILHLWKLLKYE